MNSSSFLMFCTYKKLVIEILNLSSFKICGSIKIIINVSVMCIGVHEMWDIPCIWLYDFTSSSHCSLKPPLDRVKQTL
jgi:hypothetical protein